MRVVLIADAYPPMRTSAAVQLRDLSQELVREGHQVTVLIPSSELKRSWSEDEASGVQIVRLKAPRTKDIGYVRRTINEFLLPFMMLRSLRRSPLAQAGWDGVIWYSPTIFLGPMAKALKQRNSCRSYLIIRDIFPEWAVDMGLLGRGLPYLFFKAIEHYQYSVADVIGVQTPGNLAYFGKWQKQQERRVEVLQNWLADAQDIGSSISVASSPLSGRLIFVYAGNMGVAQGMDILIHLADRLRHRQDIGFLFVGRGSEASRLRSEVTARGLENVVFYDEVDPSEVPGLYAQCHVGIVALDSRHKTHNIPGKFLTYLQAGLPVLASINPGNDLVELIQQEGVGKVCMDSSVDTMQALAEELVADIQAGHNYAGQCQMLAAKKFSSVAAARQIIHSLNA